MHNKPLLTDLLDENICGALTIAKITDYQTFYAMTSWDEDLARDVLKNEVKLNIIQVGNCLQLLRSKYSLKSVEQTLKDYRDSKAGNKTMNKNTKSTKQTTQVMICYKCT